MFDDRRVVDRWFSILHFSLVNYWLKFYHLRLVDMVRWKTGQVIYNLYHPVICYIAIENGHRNSELSQWLSEMVIFHTYVAVYQRVNQPYYTELIWSNGICRSFPILHHTYFQNYQASLWSIMSILHLVDSQLPKKIGAVFKIPLSVHEILLGSGFPVLGCFFIPDLLLRRNPPTHIN